MKRKGYKIINFLIVFLWWLPLFTKAQISINAAVDTTHNFANKQIIKTFTDYFKVANNPILGQQYWKPEELQLYREYDLLRSIYSYTRQEDCIILGIQQEKDQIYRLRFINSGVGTDDKKTVFFICDYMFYKEGESYKMGNALTFNLQKQGYKKYSKDRIDFYLPQAVEDSTLEKANQLIKNVEKFVGKTLPQKIRYYGGKNCEKISYLRGFDFSPGMMGSKDNICGLTDMKNYIMYADATGYHKHELLRSLMLLCPKISTILTDGLANMAGGSLNHDMLFHIERLYKYVSKHPEVLDDLNSFYYFDQQTVPYSVFHSIIVNYILKTKGVKSLKQFLADESLAELNIQDFLAKTCKITDAKKFFLSEMNNYSVKKKNLEFSNLFD